MSGAWFFGLAAAINVVSILMLVFTARERKRIEIARRRLRADQRAQVMKAPPRLGFGNDPAGVTTVERTRAGVRHAHHSRARPTW